MTLPLAGCKSNVWPRARAGVIKLVGSIILHVPRRCNDDDLLSGPVQIFNATISCRCRGHVQSANCIACLLLQRQRPSFSRSATSKTKARVMTAILQGLLGSFLGRLISPLGEQLERPYSFVSEANISLVVIVRILQKVQGYHYSIWRLKITRENFLRKNH